MSRYAPVFLLMLLVEVAGAFPRVEQPVEGFARVVSASRQGPYVGNRGVRVTSSYEYARDGTQAVEWESAAVQEEYSQGSVTFVWSCGLARQEDRHELYLNDARILAFSTGVIVEPTEWEKGDFALRFEPILKDHNGEVHGLMYLRVPASKAPPGEPVLLKVRGPKGNGSWYMLHHYTDTYAKSAVLTLPSGRRLMIAPTRSEFRTSEPIRWSCPLVLTEAEGAEAEEVHLEARLTKDGDERTAERQIRLEPGRQQVEVALWPAGEVPEGDWELALALSPMGGVDPLRWQGKIAVRFLTQLDIEANWPSGSLAGSLGPALRAAGMDWSNDYLRGFLGSAFAFSMTSDGGSLWQGESYDRSLSPQIASHLRPLTIDAPAQGSDAVSLDQHAGAKTEAWEAVRRAIDDGYPAVVQMRDTGPHPLPGPSSLIVGYDEEMESYTVSHAGYGKYTTRRDGFSHDDPVSWVRIMVFRPLTAPPDARAASRRAVEHAIESSRGSHPGADAPAHGLAAWEMWLDAFRDGTVSVKAAPHHAAFLRDARRAAASYLRQIEPHFPPSAAPPLRTAADRYDQVVAGISALHDLCIEADPDLQRGAEVLSRALAAERAALASLQLTLEAR